MCIAVMTPPPASSVLVSACLTRLYTFTLVSDATSSSGCVGWNAQFVTFPLFFLKGFWLLRLDSWCTTTLCDAPPGHVATK